MRKNSKYYNNGIVNKMIPEGEPIPVGFISGMLPRSKEKIEASNEKRKQTCLDKYGGVAPLCSDSIKEKAKETNLRRYGVVSPTQSKEIQDKVKKTNLKRYGVECTFQGQFREKQKRTCLQKYGVENPFQSEEVKAKIRKTNLEKYGVEYAIQSKEAQEKRDRTNIERYGTTNPVGLEFIKDKRKKTCRERYGVDNPWESKEIFEKAKRTFFERYGVDNPMHSEEIKNRLRENNIKKYGVPIPSKSDIVKEKASNTCMKKYGVPWSCMRKEARLGYSNDSVPNKEFASLLDKSNIAYEREFSLGSYIYDFKINTTLIEINPYATHNTIWSPFSKDSGISIEYHKNKSLFAEENGYHCIHVFDWDNKEKIIKYLSREEINLDNTSYTIEEACPYDSEVFLSDYCFYSYLETSINIGLYTNNEVIAVLSALELDSETFEIISYCSKYKIQNGLKILLNYLIQRYHPKNILAFQDKSKFNNNAFMQLGFYLVKQCEPELVWYMPELNYHCTSEDLNEEYLLKSGYLPIPDCGKDLLIFNV